MWSVGVVVYILLGGYAPFEGPVQELARAICRADYCFHDKYWSEISDEAKGMISGMLEVDIDKRLTAEQALYCPWMILEEEQLAVADLSGAQAGMKKQKTDGESAQAAVSAVRPIVNKYDSLDVDFTAGLGSIEEVEKRKAARTDSTMMKALPEDGEYIEDSSSGKTFEQLYKLGDVFAEGDFDPFYDAKHKQSKEKYAVKRIMRIDLDPTDAVALQDEIAVLRMVSDCDAIIHLHDVFEEPDYTYIVLEKLHGGLLIDQIAERSCYPEDDARIVIKDILSAVEYCHNKRIAIRNIKTESIMCVSRDSHVRVKLTDFSFSKRVHNPNSLSTACGTEGYVAPEILDHKPAYDVQCDMWSVGVVLYIILGGYRPFRGEGEQVWQAIRYGEYKFHKRYWLEISEDAKILISRMLTVNPIARITATAALMSDWVNATATNKK